MFAQSLLWFFSILFSRYLFIQHFCNVLSFFIFYTKILLFLLPPVVDICLCILHRLVEVSLLFWNISFFFILLDPIRVPFVSSSFQQFFKIYFFQFYCQRFLFWSFISVGFLYVSPSLLVSLIVAVSYLYSWPHFPSRFCIYVWMSNWYTYLIAY